MMQQVNFETFFEPSVAEDPSGATGCTTQWNKQTELVLYFFFLDGTFCRWGCDLSCKFTY